MADTLLQLMHQSLHSRSSQTLLDASSDWNSSCWCNDDGHCDDGNDDDGNGNDADNGDSDGSKGDIMNGSNNNVDDSAYYDNESDYSNLHDGHSLDGCCVDVDSNIIDCDDSEDYRTRII